MSEWIPVYKDGVISVAADHVGQNEGISDDAVEQDWWYERLESIVRTPVWVLVHQTCEYWHVLWGYACSNFLQPNVRVTPAGHTRQIIRFIKLVSNGYKTDTLRTRIANIHAKFQVSSLNRSPDMEGGPQILKMGHVTLPDPFDLLLNFYR